MEFGPALDLLRAGALMVRSDDKDRGRLKWISLRTGYPDGIDVNMNTARSFGVPVGTPVKFAPYFQAMRPDGMVVGWAPTPEDVLAGDWVEVSFR